MRLLFFKHHPDASAPQLAKDGDLAYDVAACRDQILWPFVVNKVHTGIAVRAMSMTATTSIGFSVRDRSSMAAAGVFTHGGVIDAGYRGELVVLLSRQFFSRRWRIRKGERIAQIEPRMVLASRSGIEEVHDFWLDKTQRGALGFGSTGR